MVDFNFCLPTKLYFGKEKELLVGSILKEENAKNILVVIGGSSCKKSGLLTRILENLRSFSLNYFLLEGIRPNPEISGVIEGIHVAKENKCDYILAIGGGSVIDTAKLIGVGYYYDGNPFDFNLKKATPSKTLPVGVILTMSAAGSEMSNSCVVQDDKSMIKKGFNSEVIRPKFVIENPELTYTVKPKATSFGIVDILMHTFERYFQRSGNDETADFLAEGILSSVIKNGKKAVFDPTNYEARANVMLCSTYSHNGITGMAKPFSLPIHQIEHGLSGMYPRIAHGEGLAILFPAWCKYYLTYQYKKFARLGKILFGINNKDEKECANEFVVRIEDYFREILSPTKFSDLGVNIDYEALANIVTNNGNLIIPCEYKDMDIEVVKQILDLAR